MLDSIRFYDLQKLRKELEELEQKERLKSEADNELKNELEEANKERKASEGVLNNEVAPAIDDLESRQALADLDMQKLIGKVKYQKYLFIHKISSSLTTNCFQKTLTIISLTMI